MKKIIRRSKIIEIHLSGPERCTTPDGKLHTGGGAVYSAARYCIRQGMDPELPVHYIRDEKLALSGKLTAFAELVWSEATDPHPRSWRPHPKDEMNPAMEKWWSAVQARRAANPPRRGRPVKGAGDTV